MWTLDSRSALPLWRLASEPPVLRLAFTTRRGGVSEPPYDSLNIGRSTDDRPEAVQDNRRRVLSALELDPARCAPASARGRASGARDSRYGCLHELRALLVLLTSPGSGAHRAPMGGHRPRRPHRLRPSHAPVTRSGGGV